MDWSFVFPGFGVGLLIGLTGVGGGALMTPILILLYQIPVLTAVGTDLLFAAVTKTIGTLAHGKHGNVDWYVVKRMASGSIPATILTLAVLKTQPVHINSFISIVLGAALLLTAVSVLLRTQIQRLLLSTFPIIVHNSRNKAAVTVFAGVVLGFLVTVTSIGAGALGATIVAIVYPALPARKIIGTDIAHALPLTAVAGIGHFALGNVELALLVTLLCGSLPGVIAGSWLSKNLPERITRFVLAGVLFTVGIKLVA